MIKNKRLITVGGTLICALGIGLFMQSTGKSPAGTREQPPAQKAPDNVKAQPAKARIAAQDTTEIALDQVTLTAVPSLPDAPEVAQLPAAPVVNAALGDDAALDTTDLPQEEPAPAFSCEFVLTAQTEAAAMVRLDLSAPCMPNERFTLHHNGMMFTEITDADGHSEFTVPALAETAVFIVAFANGEGAVANAQVTSLEYYDRAVLQWKGTSGMQIHALEYGSGYDGDGHVWADSARDESAAALGEGGFITRHGAADTDNALLAEVYTFPSGVAKRGGEVALSVEAEVTQANCGRDIEAQSIQKQPDGTLHSQDLVLAMPECSAVGDFLVLKNLLNDLKIASK